MTISYFTEAHYEELTQWWNKHQHQIIPLSSLPHGVVVSSGDKNLAMSFVYTMNGCDVAQVSWTTSNPENKLKENYLAVETAIDAVLVLAEKLNKKLIVCFSGSRGMSRILNRKNIATNKDHVLHIGSF